MRPAHFTPASFRFLRALARHNRRAWFLQHKPEYEAHLRQPALRFIGDFAAPLRGISRHYVADPRPVGGSLFRIHRDTRFSKDKTPYKTHCGMQFFHEATRAAPRAEGGFGRLDAPVFYLHLEPGACFAGAGLWHPQPDTLKRVRDYIVGNPRGWAVVAKGLELEGDRLSRPPRGYDPAHPLVEALKHKDFVVSFEFADAQACRADFARWLAGRYRRLAPLADYLCDALELRF